MIVRAALFAGGLTGAAGMSQFPEYAQQYQQRLAGAVDALDVVVGDFDLSASSAGMTRNAAISQMTGTEFLDNRRMDMQNTFSRFDRLSDVLTQMRARGPFQQLTLAPRLTDSAIAKAALDEFKPAVALTVTGAGFAAIGFVIGSSILWALIALIRMPFRRRTKSDMTATVGR
jgi:hypothetical protein